MVSLFARDHRGSEKILSAENAILPQNTAIFSADTFCTDREFCPEPAIAK
jgi:hypothetical protein